MLEYDLEEQHKLICNYRKDILQKMTLLTSENIKFKTMLLNAPTELKEKYKDELENFSEMWHKTQNKLK